MSLLRMLGKKQMEQATLWVPTAMVFGASAAGLGMYFTEWKAVLRYVPYYNGKYKNIKFED